MKVYKCQDARELGRQAAADGADLISQAVARRGAATVVVATGASQFHTLDELTARSDVPWKRVRAFHLDEYIGLDVSHPASFRRYLKERFVDRVPLAEFHYINGEADPAAECRRLGDLIARYDVDVAFVGIGENGHLAFNDPPADFTAEEPYLVVSLNDACRRQQVGEGWFGSLEEVPRQAISMSVRQIMNARHVICSAPDLRKATAVHDSLSGPVTPEVPASILQRHADARLYLDPASANRLDPAHFQHRPTYAAAASDDRLKQLKS